MVTGINPLDISLSGMNAQKTKMEFIAQNLANTDTVMTADGSFYKRQAPVFEEVLDMEGNPGGVKIKEITKENAAGALRYEPGSPYADKTGFVKYPEISSSKEMSELINAQRTYEANIAVVSSIKSMLNKALEI